MTKLIKKDAEDKLIEYANINELFNTLIEGEKNGFKHEDDDFDFFGDEDDEDFDFFGDEEDENNDFLEDEEEFDKEEYDN